MKEIDILAACDHPNVMYLKEYYEENNKIYLITGERLFFFSTPCCLSLRFAVP